MFDLLLNKTFIIEEYEIKVVDKKVPPEVFHMERRWKVKFSDVTIAAGFVSQPEAEKYIYKNAQQAFWNALWTKGFQVSWNNNLSVTQFQIKFITKEM
jgi:hypothetical protein